MADERRKRRRGRRRDRGGGDQPEERPEGRPEEPETEPDVTEESDAPGILPSRIRFGFGRRRDEEEEDAEPDDGAHRDEKRRQPRARRSGVSPLSFWRRGRARTYREEPIRQQTLSGTLRRIRGMYFPPWVPVAFIIVVVFGILAGLFFARGATGAPRIGEHHWHSTYSVFICGQRQPNFPTWEAGVHTHADGIIHIHPFTPSEEGAGARLVRWFEYGGGKLTQTEMRMPGDRQEFKNGDTCDDGSVATLQVFVNGEKLADWSRYIPQDGDRVRIVFGPEQEDEEVEEADRTIIPEDEATRTAELEVTGAEGDAAFDPATIEVRPQETVKIAVTNTGSISHSVRVAGPDGEYDTGDDYVSNPEIIEPGENGVLVVRFPEEGEFEFQDPSSPAAQGTIIVAGEPVEQTPQADDQVDDEEVDVTFDVSMQDNFFTPNEIEVDAGQTFRINLSNDGQFVHNLRIAGPDDEYDTDDDQASTPDVQRSGEDGALVGQLDDPGVYRFRCDFHPVEMVGTIVVR